MLRVRVSFACLRLYSMHTTNNYHEQTNTKQTEKSLGLELADALEHEILACRHKRRAQPHGINAGTDELHRESTCMMQSQTSFADGTGSGLLSTHSPDNDAFRYSVIMNGRVGCSGLGRLGADVVAPRLMSARPSDCWLDAAWCGGCGD